MGFFKMGYSIKKGAKSWRKSGFTGVFRYGMINMLGGFRAEVARFVWWCGWGDLNSRPAASETATLSC